MAEPRGVCGQSRGGEPAARAELDGDGDLSWPSAWGNAGIADCRSGVYFARGVHDAGHGVGLHALWRTTANCGIAVGREARGGGADCAGSVDARKIGAEVARVDGDCRDCAGIGGNARVNVGVIDRNRGGVDRGQPFW